MKTIKVYGVYGMMEWNSSIVCNNGVVLNIVFKGGSESSLGTIPAKYSTDNPVLQALIESCDYFKKGKIKIVRTIKPKATAAPTKTNNAPKPIVAPKPEEAPVAATETPIEELKTVTVSDIADARDYLTKEFNVPGGKIRNKTQIENYAMQNGIKFEGI